MKIVRSVDRKTLGPSCITVDLNRFNTCMERRGKMVRVLDLIRRLQVWVLELFQTAHE